MQVVKVIHKRWLLALGPAVLIMWLLSSSDDISVPEEVATSSLLPGQAPYEGFGRSVRSMIYDQNGYLAYTLNAAIQRQYPNQLTELELPHMQMFDGRSELWNISAASGRIRTSTGGDILQLDLEDSVEVVHQPSADAEIRLTTSWLSIEPPTRTLYTTAPVQVNGSGIDLTAVGMFADLNVNLLNFNSSIQGRYRARD
jgi:LPS export ABC transporter protein LptC